MDRLKTISLRLTFKGTLLLIFTSYLCPFLEYCTLGTGHQVPTKWSISLLTYLPYALFIPRNLYRGPVIRKTEIMLRIIARKWK